MVRRLQTSNSVTAVSTLQNVAQTQVGTEKSLHKIAVYTELDAGLHTLQICIAKSHRFKNNLYSFTFDCDPKENELK